ncbi:hypothetical protein GCM10011320_32130 [Neoroseomonas lacus]|uniref:Uncharacterized protein n=1 Tax=Neoroseomonas lacus TaxID=287609 RepID=A0A917KNU3_9PROT|nr:hypothetical protein GCM10011320_32130 [Neoroseomonas lacus]
MGPVMRFTDARRLAKAGPGAAPARALPVLRAWNSASPTDSARPLTARSKWCPRAMGVIPDAMVRLPQPPVDQADAAALRAALKTSGLQSGLRSGQARSS